MKNAMKIFMNMVYTIVVVVVSVAALALLTEAGSTARFIMTVLFALALIEFEYGIWNRKTGL